MYLFCVVLTFYIFSCCVTVHGSAVAPPSGVGVVGCGSTAALLVPVGDTGFVAGGTEREAAVEGGGGVGCCCGCVAVGEWGDLERAGKLVRPAPTPDSSLLELALRECCTDRSSGSALIAFCTSGAGGALLPGSWCDVFGVICIWISDIVSRILEFSCTTRAVCTTSSSSSSTSVSLLTLRLVGEERLPALRHVVDAAEAGPVVQLNQPQDATRRHQLLKPGPVPDGRVQYLDLRLDAAGKRDQLVGR
uniref:Secreted protein n=1 Tax=Anopheles merus TaxID=30066 RepID=A0A182VPC4_ANOME